MPFLRLCSHEASCLLPVYFRINPDLEDRAVTRLLEHLLHPSPSVLSERIRILTSERIGINVKGVSTIHKIPMEWMFFLHKTQSLMTEFAAKATATILNLAY